MAGVNEIIGDIGSLPADVAVLTRIVTALQDAKSDATSIERLVRQDEALSLLIVRRARSAYFARSSREFALRECIVRLGVRQILRFALDLQAERLMEDAGRAYCLERGAMRRGAVGGATAAEVLAKHRDHPSPDACYTAALLRDVGKIVMDMRFGDEYSQRVLNAAHPSGETFMDLEQRAFGVDHAEIGAALADRWGMPDWISEAIRHHHDPPELEGDIGLICDIVHAGDVICLWAGLGIGVDGLEYRISTRVRERLRLERAEAEEIIVAAVERVNEFDRLMDNAQGAAA